MSPEHCAKTFLDGAVAEGPIDSVPSQARVSAKTDGDVVIRTQCVTQDLTYSEETPPQPDLFRRRAIS